jgi:hypothetical protein
MHRVKLHSMFRGTVWSMIAAALLFAAPVSIQANGDSVMPAGEALDGWFPHSEDVGGSRSGLTPEDIEAVVFHLDAMEQVLRRSGAFAKGAEVVPSRAISIGRTPATLKTVPKAYRLDLRIYRPDLKTARSSGGSLSFHVNSPYQTADPVLADAQGPIHVSRPVVGEVGTSPIYLLSPERGRVRETGWVITAGDRPVWMPVSQERWIRALIGDAHEKLDAFEHEATGQAAQRRDRFEQSYEGVKRVSAENAEKMSEQFEARELLLIQMVDALRASDYDALEKLGRRDLALLGRAAIRLEEELAAMPPESRGAPAYCCEAPPINYFAPPSRAKRASLLVEPDDKRAGALLAPNPDFFRSDLPATAVQSITVTQKIMRVDKDWDAYMAEIRLYCGSDLINALKLKKNNIR